MGLYGAELSIHMVSEDMKHSSTYMTARHYVSSVKKLHSELERYKLSSISAILRESSQHTLTEYMEV
jgi:hypothetical protein